MYLSRVRKMQDLGRGMCEWGWGFGGGGGGGGAWGEESFSIDQSLPI